MASVENWQASASGDRMAGIYEKLFVPAQPELAPELVAATNFLARWAGSGRALELGVGTGRVALALAAKGVDVTGVDASPRMIDELRKRPGGADLPVLIGDFAEVPDSGEYTLVYVVFNTFFQLPSQEKQISCFQHVAARLSPGGAFVVEAFMPSQARVERTDGIQVNRVEQDLAFVSVSKHDPVAQQVALQHITIESGGIQMYPMLLRYVWPSEMDLMARLAGLRLAGRWAGWNDQPFTAGSPRHVSVYVKAD